MLSFSSHIPFISTCSLTADITRLCVASWYENTGAAALLSDGGAQGRYSYLMAEPADEAALAYDDAADAAEMLRAATAFVQPAIVPGDLPPFTGGLLGLAAFELGPRLEHMPRRPFRIEGRGAWPELLLRLYPGVISFDHQTGQCRVIGRGRNQTEADGVRDRLITLYHETASRPVQQVPLTDAPMRLETPDGVHEDKVAALVRQIHAGDLFQANLARGWSGRLRGDVSPGDVAANLHAYGAAPFGAFVNLGERAIVSNSPERFIRLGADGQLETRPIKGTRPRGAKTAEDQALAAELQASTKDLAENLMIVDLMRHDLSKVAETGSVAVPVLNALESYANVHHLVSTVTARLAAGKTAADVLAATLPAGSISGAPKVQAMKVIHEMEAARGPYCGALFTVDAGGAMDSSVLIRTLAFERDENRRWHFRAAAGGGIVADSDARSERIETETKLSLIRRVLDGC